MTRCVPGLRRIAWDYFEIQQNCMMFKAKTAKSMVIPLLTLGVLTVKFVSHHKYLGIVLHIEFSDDQDIQRQLRYQYYAVM